MVNESEDRVTCDGGLAALMVFPFSLQIMDVLECRHRNTASCPLLTSTDEGTIVNSRKRFNNVSTLGYIAKYNALKVARGLL